eukprot:COSAG04_NODE_5556_length_1571_cov_1.207880_2_plen_94_part_00
MVSAAYRALQQRTNGELMRILWVARRSAPRTGCCTSSRSRLPGAGRCVGPPFSRPRSAAYPRVCALLCPAIGTALPQGLPAPSAAAAEDVESK